MDFFKKQAASYLSSQQEGHDKPDSENPAKPAPAAEGHGDSSAPQAKKTDQDDVPSYQELMASANVLLGAAKGQFGQKEGEGAEGAKPQRYDSGKLAAAAEDLLDGAEHYGKLKGTPFGEYVQKAEDYLHDYQAKHGAPPPAHDRAKARAAGAEEDFKESKSREKTGEFDRAPEE